jgi:hypothetical protein
MERDTRRRAGGRGGEEQEEGLGKRAPAPAPLYRPQPELPRIAAAAPRTAINCISVQASVHPLWGAHQEAPNDHRKLPGTCTSRANVDEDERNEEGPCARTGAYM